MLELITNINQHVNDFVWGVPAMICIIGVGLLLSIRTGFLQIRRFPYAMKATIGKVFKKTDAGHGAVTPFQAVCTALAGCCLYTFLRSDRVWNRKCNTGKHHNYSY